MTDEDWKAIVDELTIQISQISIERAVARVDARKLAEMVNELKKQISDSNQTVVPESKP